MNPTRDVAVWVFTHMPDAAPLWLKGAMIMFALFAVLAVIAAPLCGFAAWITTRRDRRRQL